MKTIIIYTGTFEHKNKNAIQLVQFENHFFKSDFRLKNLITNILDEWYLNDDLELCLEFYTQIAFNHILEWSKYNNVEVFIIQTINPNQPIRKVL